MNRAILCRECAQGGTKLHREDVQQGWKQRLTFISSKTPEGHGLTLNGCFMPMKDIICDDCGQPITGQIAVARTRWRSEEGISPGLWEREYGEILPENAVAVIDAMLGGAK